MIDLLTALQERFDAELTYLFPGGLFLSKAPDNAELPLCVYTIVSSVPDYSTADEYGAYPYTEVTNIQFDIYAAEDFFVVHCLDLLDQAFNQKELAFEYDGFVQGRRVSAVPIRHEDDGWRGTYEFRFWVSRTV